METLIKGDCLKELKNIPDKSVDLAYMDLCYGQTALLWDKKFTKDDWVIFWKELKRVAKNDRTPFFFSCTTKFGFDIIESNKAWFRWDMVWKKNRGTSFLNAYKLPIRKHEMIYCFAKKCPEYDVSSHSEYKEDKERSHQIEINDLDKTNKFKSKTHTNKLPTSDITPPTEEHELVYCFAKKSPAYDVTSHKTGDTTTGNSKKDMYLNESQANSKNYYNKDHTKQILNSPLPTSDITPSSWCEFSLDNKTGHRTAKPIALMEFLLKYWTKDGDTVLDPTMGSGSMGIACKNMNRKFIGIELDDDIFKLAQERLK